MTTAPLLPPGPAGLYDPEQERDACGVGFVAHVRGERSHGLVTDADRILRHMDHRGACGCESNTGDGAGMLTALPHEFLADAAARAGVPLPEPGRYACGNVFLPRDPAQRRKAKAILGTQVARFGQTRLVVLGGLGAAFALYVATVLVRAFGSAGMVAPVVAAWMPVLAALLLGAAILLRTEDG